MILSKHPPNIFNREGYAIHIKEHCTGLNCNKSSQHFKHNSHTVTVFNRYIMF